MSDPTEGFFDRFVHPRLARVAAAGAAVWLGSFLIAASGLAVREFGRYALGATLLFLSGVVGLLGVVVLGGCALWLCGVWVGRRLG